MILSCLYLQRHLGPKKLTFTSTKGWEQDWEIVIPEGSDTGTCSLAHAEEVCDAQSFLSHCVVYEVLQELQVWASNGQPSLRPTCPALDSVGTGKGGFVSFSFFIVRQENTRFREKRSFLKGSKMLLGKWTGLLAAKSRRTLHSPFHGCLQISCTRKRRDFANLPQLVCMTSGCTKYQIHESNTLV